MILDANAGHHLTGKTEDGRPVLNWLTRQDGGGLIVGGKVKRELAQGGLGRFLLELDRAGRLIKLDDAQVDDMAEALDPQCKSDDPHIIAAATISKCRLIFSHDEDLHYDAKKLLKPKASIYTSKNHAHLLQRCTC